MPNQNDREFHGKLDRFMREKIKQTQNADPSYFTNRLNARDILPFLNSIFPHSEQKEEIECKDEQKGNINAVRKLMEEMPKRYQFAFNFIKGLKACAQEDLVKDLLIGLDIGDLPPGDNTDFIRRLSGLPSPPPSPPPLSPPPPYSKADELDVPNLLHNDQEEALSAIQTNRNGSRSPSSVSYQRRHSRAEPEWSTSSINGGFSLENELHSTRTTDNNPSGGITESDNVANDLLELGAVDANVLSRTISETTGILHGSGNMDGKPRQEEYPAMNLPSDVHISELRLSDNESDETPSTAVAATDMQRREVSERSVSEYQGTRYDALIPSPPADALCDSLPAGSNSTQASETKPKEVMESLKKQPATDPHQTEPASSSRGHNDRIYRATSLQKTSTAESVDGATLSTIEIVEELPPKNLKSSRKPSTRDRTKESSDGIGSFLEAFTASDAITVVQNPQDNIDDDIQPNKNMSPTDQMFNIVVACLASVCITAFILKRLQH